MLIYKPARQFMAPNNVPIDPKVENEFQLTVSGQVCKAYRFSTYDMDNERVESASTDKIELESPLYDGDTLRHLLAENVLEAGNTYKWQMDLYANDLLFNTKDQKTFTVTAATSDILTASGDFGLSDGDMVTISSTGTLPTPLAADTPYYIKTIENSTTTFYLCESMEEAKKEDGTYINITATGSGTHTILYVSPELICNSDHNLSTGDMVFVEGKKSYPVKVNLEVVKNLLYYADSEETTDFSSVTLNDFNNLYESYKQDATLTNYTFNLYSGEELVGSVDYVHSDEPSPAVFVGGNGDGEIPSLVFDTPGVYTFTILESAGSAGANEDVTYDANTVTATITVEKSAEDFEVLTASVEYSKGTKVLEEGENEFVNIFYIYFDDSVGSNTSVVSETTEEATTTAEESDSYSPTTEFVSEKSGEFADGELPKPLEKYKAYYVRKLDSKSIALFEYAEGAKNDSGRIGFTTNTIDNIVITNVAISEQVVFTAYDMPVFKLEPETITMQSHLFIPEYSHPQDVMVNNWVAIICPCDSDRLAGDDVLEEGNYDTSGTVYRAKMEYEFDGLLNGMDYFVRFMAETNVGQKIDTGFTRYSVSYESAKIDIQPRATNDEFNSCVKVDWGGLVSIPGIFDGGDPSFVYDFINEGDIGLNINDGESLTYKNLNMLDGSMPPSFFWSPNSDDFAGVIMRASNTESSESLEIRYEAGVFYLLINGIEKLAKLMEISSRYAYLIGFVDKELVVLTIGVRGGLNEGCR